MSMTTLYHIEETPNGSTNTTVGPNMTEDELVGFIHKMSCFDQYCFDENIDIDSLNPADLFDVFGNHMADRNASNYQIVGEVV